MKYFTKYLPVEGEIREGDKYLFHTTVMTAPNTFSDHDEASDGGRKKVKLFLCSRDINVGNENINTPRGIGKCISRRVSPRFKTHDLVIIEFDNTDDGTECYALNEFEAFKVVGEVSPNSLLYCKEGMEYEKEDLFANGCGHNWSDKSPEVGKFKFKIKGPCGHFH